MFLKVFFPLARAYQLSDFDVGICHENLRKQTDIYVLLHLKRLLSVVLSAIKMYSERTSVQ